MSLDRRESGFAYLELIVVLVIVALAVIIALPMAERSRHSFHVRSAAVDVASALKSARAGAMRTNLERRFVVDLDQRRFFADGMSRPHALPRGVTVSYEVPIGEQPAESIGTIRFRPDGTSSGGTITLVAQRQRATVSVDWLTGRTAIDWSSR
ncbi:MAG: GspH/FimT family pseudopilin [Hyphomicrobium sp.]